MENIFEVLKAGVTPFHCVEYAEKQLNAAGFQSLSYGGRWDLKRGGRYVMEHNGTAIFAFTIGENYKPGDMIRIAGAHTDYPTLRLKYHPDFQNGGYAQVNVEVYGGAITGTWLDRPLGLAGRVIARSQDPFAPKEFLYRSDKPLMVIPNLAIHMNREVNAGVAIDNQIDLMPIVEALPENVKSADYIMSYLAEELKIEKEDILDFELNTFVFAEPVYVGPKNSMISSPRIDNQSSCCALESAIEDGIRKSGINLIALYDNEEVGSKGKQGAGSMMLPNMLRRILENLGLDREQIEADLYRGMILSCDVAHAFHPNKGGKYDPINHPVMGRGFCFKTASVQSYATDAKAIGMMMQICDAKKIPYQRFVNRSNLKGGGTIGSIMSSNLPMLTVDMGVPQLAMHSACELMGTADIDSLTAAVTAFFAWE